MKKTWFAGLMLGMLAIPVRADGDGIGLGFIAGVPAGLSAKLPLGGINSLNLLAGWDISRSGNGALYFHGDYIWHNFGLIPVNEGKLALYYGPGAHASVSNDFSVGVRAAFGLLYQFSNAPLEALLEIGPGINILPDTDFIIGAGIGMRFLF